MALLAPVDAVAQRVAEAGARRRGRCERRAARRASGGSRGRGPGPTGGRRRGAAGRGVPSPPATWPASISAPHHGDAEPAREVVVTRARGAHRLGRVPWRSERTGAAGATPGEHLEQLADLRAGEPVVAVAALRHHRQQPGVDEPAQVPAAVDGATPASVASTLAGSARPSPSASSIRARAGSASTAPRAARSASP